MHYNYTQWVISDTLESEDTIETLSCNFKLRVNNGDSIFPKTLYSKFPHLN